MEISTYLTLAIVVLLGLIAVLLIILIITEISVARSFNQWQRTNKHVLQPIERLHEVPPITQPQRPASVLRSSPPIQHEEAQAIAAVEPAKEIKQTEVNQAPLSDEQKHALEVLRSNIPAIFLTGAAGTGKSFVLRKFVQEYEGRCVVVAPTGMAALNAGGQTIHSFFRLPPRTINPEDVKVVENNVLYREIDVVVIDEISMVRADVMDAIDIFLRKNGRDRHKPFGGTRLVFVGDLHQLPPIVSKRQEQEFVKDRYDGSPYFYSAKVFDECSVEVIELKEVRRQKDPTFIDILNAIRTNSATARQISWLNERSLGVTQSLDGSVTLTPRRDAASHINLDQLAKLSGAESAFEAEFEGDLDASDTDRDELKLPVDAVLRLKPGAQVMFIKNDLSNRWVNGTLGRVHSFDNSLIKVDVINGPSAGLQVELGRETWRKIKYQYSRESKRIDSKETGSVMQFPLTLAWAVTIHKSQGATYERVNIDLGSGAFADGQTYVALSRCRSPQGISLAQPIRNHDIRLDPKIRTWKQQVQRAKQTTTGAATLSGYMAISDDHFRHQDSLIEGQISHITQTTPQRQNANQISIHAKIIELIGHQNDNRQLVCIQLPDSKVKLWVNVHQFGMPRIGDIVHATGQVITRQWSSSHYDEPISKEFLGEITQIQHGSNH